MIVTYDILVDLSVRRYRYSVTDLAQRYRCVVIILILTNQLHTCPTRLHKWEEHWKTATPYLAQYPLTPAAL